MSLVDIHTHILPGIDDGPEDLEGALAMARSAVGAGIDTLVATPHLRADFPRVALREIAPRTAELQAQLDEEGIALTLVAGAEVSLSWAVDARPSELKLAAFGEAGSDLLIEAPSVSAVGLRHMLLGLQSRGFRLTLAHPERNPDFQRDLSGLEELVEQGVLLQVNASSLRSSRRREGFAALARLLCQRGLAHVLASDGHRGERWRPVSALAEGVQAAAALVGRERALWMASDAPRAIVAGAPLPEAPAIAQRGRRAGLMGAWRRS